MSIPFSADSLGKSTPAWLCDLNSSLWNILEGAHFITEYLPGDSKLVVHTDRVDDETLATVTDMLGRFVPGFIEVVQYNHHIEVSWRDINKYAECVTYKDLYNVNPDYGNDVTTDGEWVYPLPNLVTASDLSSSSNLYCLFRSSTKLKKWSVDLPKAKQTFAMFRDSSLEEFDGALPVVESHYTGENKMFSGNNLKIFRSSNFNIVNGSKWFWYCGRLHTFDADLSKLRDGDMMLMETQLNKKSALRIFNSLSAYTSGNHRLGIGIHVDHKTDEEVLAAIDAATAKGWTVSVLWRGTATAATVSTLSLWDEEETDPIYARIAEEPEHGDYVTPEGTRVIIDWGHLITSPDDKTPEEMGYAQYVSIGEVMYKHNLSYYTE